MTNATLEHGAEVSFLTGLVLFIVGLFFGVSVAWTQYGALDMFFFQFAFVSMIAGLLGWALFNLCLYLRK